MATPEELREASQRLAQVAELEEEADNDLEEAKKLIGDEIKLSLRNNLSVFSEHEAVSKICNDYSLNASQAKKTH